MSNLDELITGLCPDGIKYIMLGEVCKIKNGFAFKSSEYVETGIRVIRISDVQKGRMSDKDTVFYPYNSEIEIRNYLLRENDLVMSLTGNTGRVAMLSKKDLPAALNQRVACLRPDSELLLTRFLFHLLDSNFFENEAMANSTGGGQKNLSTTWLSLYKIPLPPLPVQREIVRILDNFTELTSELTSELTARKKQYEYYKKLLLSQSSNAFVTKLGEVATLKTGSKPKEIFEEKDKFEYINAGTSNSGYVRSFNCEGDTVTTPSRGQGGIGFVGYQKKSFWLGPLCYRIKSKDTNILLNRYLYHYLSCFNDKIMQYKNEGGTPSVNASDLVNIAIDIPSINEQKRIITILDRFDTICNDLNSGLPAEIEARRKQYEYYRDKLLSFEEASA